MPVWLFSILVTCVAIVEIRSFFAQRRHAVDFAHYINALQEKGDSIDIEGVKNVVLQSFSPFWLLLSLFAMPLVMITQTLRKDKGKTPDLYLENISEKDKETFEDFVMKNVFLTSPTLFSFLFMEICFLLLFKAVLGVVFGFSQSFTRIADVFVGTSLALTNAKR